METTLTLLENAGHAILQLIMSPYFYGSLVLVAIIYRKQVQLQRKLFFARFHSLIGEWLRTIFWGLLIGLIASAAFIGIGVQIDQQLVPLLWLMAIGLMLVRVRWVCFAYVIGLLGIVHFVLQTFPQVKQWTDERWGAWLIQPVLDANFFHLFLLVGGLHLAEAVLVRWQGSRMATPMFFMSKRGKLIGGYHMQRFWPVPLLLLDVQHASSLLFLLPFPVMIGFSDRTITQLPTDKARSSSNVLMMYGLLVIGLAYLVLWIPETIILASLLMMISHEGIRWLSHYKEDKLLPIYTNNSLGLKVLAVIPGGPAAQLGIVAGETIHKVNGVLVQSRLQMYEAMNRNSAYCKLEVFNIEGQLKFLNRAMFSGEHHQLGIILAPDDQVRHYAAFEEYSLLSYLRLKWTALRHKS